MRLCVRARLAAQSRTQRTVRVTIGWPHSPPDHSDAALTPSLLAGGGDAQAEGESEGEGGGGDAPADTLLTSLLARESTADVCTPLPRLALCPAPSLRAAP